MMDNKPLTWKEFKRTVDTELKKLNKDNNVSISFIDIYPLGSAATETDYDIGLNEDGELTVFGMWL